MTRVASFMSLPFLAIHLADNLRLNSFMIGFILGMNGLTGALGGLSEVICRIGGGGGRSCCSAFSVWTGVFFGFWFAEQPYHFIVLNGLNGLCRAFFEPTSKP